MKNLLIAIALLIVPLRDANAQMLALNVDAPPGITVTVLSDGVLDFGTLIQNQGQVSINLMDPGTEVISIEGDHTKDLYVTLTPPPSLQLDAANTLPFTLGASYSNIGENNKSQAIDFPNSLTATFPIYDQNRGQKPPPWANNNTNGNGNGNGNNSGGSNTTVKAYLYLYGSTTVGNDRAGTYTGTINLTVSYAN